MAMRVGFTDFHCDLEGWQALGSKKLWKNLHHKRIRQKRDLTRKQELKEKLSPSGIREHSNLLSLNMSVHSLMRRCRYVGVYACTECFSRVPVSFQP